MPFLPIPDGRIYYEVRGEGFPVLQFTPRVTAEYRIRVAMEECRLNPCWYAAGVIPSSGAKP